LEITGDYQLQLQDGACMELTHYIVAGAAFVGMFILFLVLSKTLNNIVNHITKLEYFLQKELDLQKEMVVIKQMLKEKDEENQQAEAKSS
jgi:hypothetical protein